LHVVGHARDMIPASPLPRRPCGCAP
jgi:hypothetical protein